MEPASPGTPALPNDLLLVEDDPIIALDFEDTILALGVKTVRTAAGVARALQLIAERAPDFALLDVGLVREKSFAIAERLDALKIPFAFVTGYGADVRFAASVCGATAAIEAVLDRGAGNSPETSCPRWRQEISKIAKNRGPFLTPRPRLRGEVGSLLRSG